MHAPTQLLKSSSSFSVSVLALTAILTTQPSHLTLTHREAVARENLTAAGVRCDILTVDVETDEFRPGGRVGVTVSCTASMSDVTLLGVPGERTFSARSVEVVDRYRGGGS